MDFTTNNTSHFFKPSYRLAIDRINDDGEIILKSVRSDSVVDIVNKKITYCIVSGKPEIKINL